MFSTPPSQNTDLILFLSSDSLFLLQKPIF